VKASQKTLGLYEDDNWLIILPMFHVSGLSIIMRSLYNATSATIFDKFDENQLLEVVNSGKINMISLVPTILTRIANKLNGNN
ncbi:AMP-binding protein, partial [Streptococcus thermophilus]|nr:AMP-binding protein [Streptococcus thermophilus]